MGYIGLCRCLLQHAEAGVDAADTKISAQKEKAPAVVEKVRAKQAEVAATTRWVGHGKQSQFNLAAWQHGRACTDSHRPTAAAAATATATACATPCPASVIPPFPPLPHPSGLFAFSSH